MKIQVMGAGSLGSLLGGLLSDGGHDVHLVGRRSQVEAVREAGLRIVGVSDLETRPTASLEPVDADLTLVTVKSYDNSEAARAVAGRQDLVVSLSNGMGNEQVLEHECGCEVLAGAVTYGARLVEPGFVEHTGEGEVELGAPSGGGSPAAKRLARELSPALNVEAREDMPRVLWTKLAVNSGINPVTALTGLTNGEALHRAGGTMQAAARETAAVARSEGVDLDPDDAATRTAEVARRTSSNTSSMLRDVELGRRTEVEAINGHVVENAGRTGVEVPVNRVLLELVLAAAAR